MVMMEFVIIPSRALFLFSYLSVRCGIVIDSCKSSIPCAFCKSIGNKFRGVVYGLESLTIHMLHRHVLFLCLAVL